MLKHDLIMTFQNQLANKRIELEEKYDDLINEYTTQKRINELLYKAKEDVSYLAEYFVNISGDEKENCNSLILDFIDKDELANLYKESRNLYYMKKHNFDQKGVTQYEESKSLIENFCHKLYQYNLSRNYKYINISQIMEIKSYLKRIVEVEGFFQDGRLISSINDIDEVEYILDKSDIDDQEKVDIAFAIFEDNNKFYFDEEEDDIDVI